MRVVLGQSSRSFLLLGFISRLSVISRVNGCFQSSGPSFLPWPELRCWSVSMARGRKVHSCSVRLINSPLSKSSTADAEFIATSIVGTYGSSLAIIYAYNASNTSGHTKKVTVNAMTLAAFCVANIVGTETFLPKDAPGYLPGKISILVLLTSQLALCFVIRWVNLWMNRKKRWALEELKRRNNWSEEDVKRERERAAFVDMTDKQ